MDPVVGPRRLQYFVRPNVLFGNVVDQGLKVCHRDPIALRGKRNLK